MLSVIFINHCVDCLAQEGSISSPLVMKINNISIFDNPRLPLPETNYVYWKTPSFLAYTKCAFE